MTLGQPIYNPRFAGNVVLDRIASGIRTRFPKLSFGSRCSTAISGVLVFWPQLGQVYTLNGLPMFSTSLAKTSEFISDHPFI